MDQSELKYAIRVGERAFFIRFYCWLYEADKNKISFCKLFWAYVCVAPMLLLRGLQGVLRRLGYGALLLGSGIGKTARFIAIAGRPLGWLVRLSKYQMRQHERERAEERARQRELKEREVLEELKKPPKPPSEIMQNTLGLIEHGGTMAVMAYRALDPIKTAKVEAARVANAVVYRAGRITSTPLVGRLMFALAACVSIVSVGMIIFVSAPVISLLGTGFGHGMGAAANGIGEATSASVYATTHSEISLWALLGILGIALVATLGMTAMAIGVPYLIYTHILAPSGQAIERVGKPTGRVIGGGLRGFAQVMYLGYYAVKTSTCPRIEVEPRPDLIKTREIEREIDLR